MPAQLFSIPSSRSAHQQQAGSALGAVLSSCRSAFVAVGLMSGLISVLPSHSIATLVGLALLVTGLYIFQGVLDLIRGRVLVRIGATLEHDLRTLAYFVLVKLPLSMGARFTLSFRDGEDLLAERGIMVSHAASTLSS